MVNVIVAFPKQQDAKSIQALLNRNGFHVAAVCTSGSQALAAADMLGSGILVCGYRFSDMIYSALREDLPAHFEMLLLASARVIDTGVPDGVLAITMPLKINHLLDSLDMLVVQMERRRKKRRQTPTKRNEKEKKIIDEAKALLMERNHMTEDEAHRYLQKNSMDSGNSLVETAEMVFALMKN